MLTLAEFADQPTERRLLTCHRAWERASGLIEHYQLHREVDQAVDITPLLGCFDLRFMTLPANTQGFALDLGDQIIIALNDKLSTEQTRFVAAHEVGHVALWHPNQLNSCLQGQWLYDWLELEASAVAAYLLLPKQAVSEGLIDHRGQSRVEEIAARYAVPTELVLVRRALLAQAGF